jgi:hypothetical protein
VYWARQGRISIDVGVGGIAVAGSYFAALPVLRRLRRERKQGRSRRRLGPSPRPVTAAPDVLHPGHLRARLAAMASSSNPEDEYADDEYADHDAEDREQPSVPSEIPDDEPEDDVLEQRQEVPYRDDDR